MALTIRTMTAADHAGAKDVLDRAFNEESVALTGRGRLPFFGDALLPQRTAADPEGPLVAEEDGRIVGALGSSDWGALAWFGPVAVEPGRQGQGIGRALVGAWTDRQRARGAELLGLETWAQSGGHLRLYSSLGFQPLWLSAALSRVLPPGPGAFPAGASRFSLLSQQERVAALDDLAALAGRLYAGLDWRAEVLAVEAAGAGDTLLLEDSGGITGLAVCQTGTLTPHPDHLIISVLAVDPRPPRAVAEQGFLRLLDAVEALARALGRTRVLARVCTRYTAAYAALQSRGYRDGGAMARLKRGSRADYERADTYVLDSWL